MLKQKFSLGERALFPIFWKKNWKKSRKKFSIFFFTKICFSGLEKVYVQLLVLNFFFWFWSTKNDFWQFWRIWPIFWGIPTPRQTRLTRPIDAKLWEKLCLWIIFNIKISHYQTPPYQRSKIFQIFCNVLYMMYVIHRI